MEAFRNDGIRIEVLCEFPVPSIPMPDGWLSLLEMQTLHGGAPYGRPDP